MKAPMWLIVLFYAAIALGLSVGTIQAFTGSPGIIWLIWGAVGVLLWYTVIRRIKTAVTEGWITKSVIIDQRAMGISRTSGYISFIYLMLYLLFSIIGLTAWGFEDPLNYMVIGFISALSVFVVLQLIQLAKK